MDKTYRKQLLSGVFYTAISKYSGLLISLVTSAVLARLLSPKDFGAIAIATIFITFFAILSDLGVGAAIVQNKALDVKDYRNLFSFTFYLALLLAFFFYFLSPFVGSYYKNDSLVTVIKLLSVSVFFTTINTVPSSLLLKDCKFRFVAIRTLIIQIILAPISIFAAFRGVGIYALVISPFLSSIILFIVNYKVRYIPLILVFELDSIKKVGSFSLFQFLFNSINFFTRNLDKLLVGRLIGMEALGYFDKSYRLMMLPLSNLTHIITPSFHPIFSRFQNDLNLQRVRYFNILKYLGYVAFPLGVLLFYTAKELVMLVFGDQWLLAVPSFQILCISIPTQLIGSTQGGIFQATNKTNVMFYTGLSNAIVYILLLVSGILIWHTIEAVAAMFVLACYVNCWTYYVLCRYVLHCAFRDFWVLFVKPFILAATLVLIFEVVFVHYWIIDSLLFALVLKTFTALLISYVFYSYFCGFSVKGMLKTLK